jgi:hypothetical protein
MKELNEVSYLNVLVCRLFNSTVEEATIFAPVQNVIGFHLQYDTRLGPLVSDVVVEPKSGHMYASECKNISNYLVHMLLFESHVKIDAATDDLNQPVEHKLQKLRFPNHGKVCLKSDMDEH